jgi:hypothetical protein
MKPTRLVVLAACLLLDAAAVVAQTSRPPAGLAGNWSGTATVENQAVPLSMSLSRLRDSSFVGTYTLATPEGAVTDSVRGFSMDASKVITFTGSYQGTPFAFRAWLVGDTLSGTWHDMGGGAERASGPWSLVRKKGTSSPQPLPQLQLSADDDGARREERRD